MGTTVLIGALVGAVLLHRTDQVSRQVADGVGPARVAAARLQAALRDQETGLRGSRTGSSWRPTTTGSAPSRRPPTRFAGWWAATPATPS